MLHAYSGYEKKVAESIMDQADKLGISEHIEVNVEYFYMINGINKRCTIHNYPLSTNNRLNTYELKNKKIIIKNKKNNKLLQNNEVIIKMQNNKENMNNINNDKVISEKEIQKNLSRSLEPEVKSWNKITKIANKTFVPESEESRNKGAGGGDAND